MKLKAKIKADLLDLILNGEKDVELRSIEHIELTDGERTRCFEVNRIEQLEPREGVRLMRALPQWFTEDNPIIEIAIGTQLKTPPKTSD